MSFNNFSLFLDPSLLGLKNQDVYEYPLMQSALQPIALVAFYSLFVFNLGPKLMKNRDPFSLKSLIIAYNAIQIVLNGIVFMMIARLMSNFPICCSPPNNTNNEIDISVRKAHYYFTMLKFLDLLDTVFFVLRKKHNQITFLHLHHHIGMALTTWASIKYVPGGVPFYVFIWNTFVHFVMYTYYLITAVDSSKTIWWKKYITQLQLCQHWFCLIVFLIHTLNTNCSYPKTWLVYYLLNVCITIFLFTKFYIKSYIEKPKLLKVK